MRRWLAVALPRRYTPNYDSIDCAAQWARDSLDVHRRDKREYLYTREQWEQGRTHDELWNASQLEMVHLGKMHGFMRMYWVRACCSCARRVLWCSAQQRSLAGTLRPPSPTHLVPVL